MSGNNSIVGRIHEMGLLNEVYDSPKSEFVVVYGRRRVGKTYLITRHLRDKFAFRMIGRSHVNLAAQLLNFHVALASYDPDQLERSPPATWFEAFQRLMAHLEDSPMRRKVVFFDELPWLDTRRSGFISALEHFWNSWAAMRTDVLLIGCGSAASWMYNKLLRNTGGLHNRVTRRIKLHPFTLAETEAFIRSRGGQYDRYQLLQLYMAMGGIPFYLEQIQTNRSIAQNIDQLFFTDIGALRQEYHELYRSLFEHYQRHLHIIEILAARSKGMTRAEISKRSSLREGGSFSTVLSELEQSGFIGVEYPFGRTRRGAVYRLTDPYTLFYHAFVKDSKAMGPGSWLARLDTSRWRAWSGYAFEDICKYHVHAIKKALGISGVYTETSTWELKAKSGGAQIDLIIDRRDHTINICEIKFSQDPYRITKKYAENLRHKISAFRTSSDTRKTLLLTMVTTYGLKHNQYVRQLVADDLNMDILFVD